VVAVVEAFDAVQTFGRILAENGPLSEDDIARRLRERGVDDPDTLLDEVFDEMTCPARQLVDDRWVWLPTLLAGRVFTHRLDADEVAHDMLTVAPDLPPLTEICEYEPYGQFVDGSAAPVAMPEYDAELLEQRGIPDEVVDEAGVLLLIPGTLARLGAAEGDLVGLRLSDQGLVVERITMCAPAEVGARLAATVDPDEPVYFNAAVWTACAEDPAVFTEPLPPLADVLEDYGLAFDGDWLAPAGFDFDSWHFERRCAALAELHDLDPDDAFVLHTMVKLFERMSLVIEAVESADADEPPADASTAAGYARQPEEAEFEDAEPAADGFADLVGELGSALADPRLAELLLAETIGTGRDGASALGMLAEVLEPKVPRAARVACRWLRGVARERMGDIDAAERELAAAESMDPDWPLPLIDLARIASDRGDVERGLALLRRANAEPDHPLVQLLQRHRTEPRRDVGRNALCWCGSGRKYKKCHLGREQLPLSERVGWLYVKAGQHAQLSGWNDLLIEAAYERSRYAVEDPDALGVALADPLVLDAVLFEGGAFEEFLEVRGSLLPDDERLLAEQWLSVQRSVFEVEKVNRAQVVIVRDVRTGDTHEVRQPAVGRQLKPGQLLCARVVPAGDSMQFLGVLEPVAPHERDRLIDLLDTEPDAVTLVAQLSRRFAPPTLVDNEGDLLVLDDVRRPLRDVRDNR
jgi:hypothetical protein